MLDQQRLKAPGIVFWETPMDRSSPLAPMMKIAVKPDRKRAGRELKEQNHPRFKLSSIF
jgi:hypothetical protein